MQKLLTLFQQKNKSVYAIFNDQKFNDTLTNDTVSFEQSRLNWIYTICKNMCLGLQGWKGWWRYWQNRTVYDQTVIIWEIVI